MPKQGQSVETCVLLSWIKKKGERVKQGDILFSYETDKASFEFEAPASGVLLDVFFPEQADIPVLTNVAVIGEPGEDVEQFRPGTSSASGPAKEKSLDPSPRAKVDTSARTTDLPETAQSPQSAESQGASSPRARKTAEARGIDLATLSGSGPQGRIIERDVLAATPLTKTAAAHRSASGLASPAEGTGIGGRIRAIDLVNPATPSAGAATDDTVTEVKLSTLRKIVATRMYESLQQTAQLTMSAFADATALLAFRKRVKASAKELGLPDITVTDLIALAVARTLPAFPELNAIYKDNKVLQYKHVHLAMAVDTPRGLMVPVVRFADGLPLAALAAELKAMAAKCREGSINPDLLSGGTITITNLGMFGIDSFTPILNAPQVAILGVNAIAPKPLQTESGAYELRPHIGFSLTIDHRVVDGAPGARFLRALCDNIAKIDFLVAVW
jgi:pyruvate dehydrogenase E2 component (dihydrolipoamide acetyltransferase)